MISKVENGVTLVWIRNAYAENANETPEGVSILEDVSSDETKEDGFEETFIPQGKILDPAGTDDDPVHMAHSVADNKKNGFVGIYVPKP